MSQHVISNIAQRLPGWRLRPPPVAAEAAIPVRGPSAIAAILSQLGAGARAVVDSSPTACWLASTQAGRRAALGGPLTPDQIVYCRSVPLLLEPTGDARSAWSAYEAEHGHEPWVALLPGIGFVAARASGRLAEITRVVYADAAAVSRDADALGGVSHLGPRDRRFIEEWEVEAHRRAVLSRPS